MAAHFQIVQPFGAQTVRENIAVGAHLHHGSRAAALRAAEAVGERVGLAAHLDKLAANLTIAGASGWSSRERSRRQPKVLLLDEVLAGLNPREIDEVLRSFAAFATAGLPS